ncbi:MAG TPA: DUF116 domain-containing protein [Gemmatimonadaceae bacterium]|nr:DUF116 domain-containing protein [Gemmatimonadaceae bacterium]
MTTNAPIRQSGQLIKIETDRRLGHEWDEWDGAPLPNGGNFAASARLYFGFTAAGIVLGALVLAAGIYLLGPRLGMLAPWLPVALYAAVVVLTVLAALWLGMIALSFYSRRVLLPERLAERGLLLRTMQLAWRTGELFGVQRDWTGHAAVAVYDRLALARTRKVGADELLILIPRCLSRESLDGVLDIARRYGVSAFVATRGQLARRVIKERRPKAVVAVACERDMVSGLHDVAGHVPVLGLTMTLPNGPCRDAALDLPKMEEFVKRYLVGGKE